MRLIAIFAAVLIIAVVALVFGKRHARRYQRQRKIRIDRFKLKRRHAAIELEVFGSREVVEAIRTYAKEQHVSIEEASKRAHQYLQEIVPKFNILAYYRLGAPIARAIMHFLYRPVVEHKALREFNVPEGVLFQNLERYGNTSTASVPIALCEALQQRDGNPGRYVSMIGFGAPSKLS